MAKATHKNIKSPEYHNSDFLILTFEAY